MAASVQAGCDCETHLILKPPEFMILWSLHGRPSGPRRLCSLFASPQPLVRRRSRAFAPRQLLRRGVYDTDVENRGSASEYLNNKTQDLGLHWLSPPRLAAAVSAAARYS